MRWPTIHHLTQICFSAPDPRNPGGRTQRRFGEDAIVERGERGFEALVGDGHLCKGTEKKAGFVIWGGKNQNRRSIDRSIERASDREYLRLCLCRKNSRGVWLCAHIEHVCSACVCKLLSWPFHRKSLLSWPFRRKRLLSWPFYKTRLLLDRETILIWRMCMCMYVSDSLEHSIEKVSCLDRKTILHWPPF